MGTKHVAIIPPSVEKRLTRIEDLLLEMRHEQDMILRGLAKTQAQIDALAKSPLSAPTDLVELRQQPASPAPGKQRR